MTKKLRNLTQLKIDPGYRRYLLLPNIILVIIYMFSISQLSAMSNNGAFTASEEIVSPTIIASYEITDANTAEGSCPGAHGYEVGVILQKGNPNFPVTGNYNAWRVKDMLILDEYDNGTAKIWGNVIDEHGNIGIVDMGLSNKTQAGNTWSAQCYVDGIVGPKTFYRSFYGTITVDGVAYVVEPNQTGHHFIVADGAGLKPGQFGLGAWTAGSFGVGGEWFGNLGTNCLLNVDAGDDIEACNEETVELTAVASGISECVGGCEYPIESVSRCFDSNNMSDVWLNNTNNSNKGFVTSSSKFETFDDGTARYTAIGSNGLDNIEVDVTFSGYTTTAPPQSPKENDCGTYDTSDWVYWTQTSGTIKTDNHGTLTVSRAGPSMQMGIGADVTRDGFGASGWLTISGGDGFYTAGDINIKLGNCTPIAASSSASYMWSTNNGNIIGNANQKTITVDKSGTYNVIVSDCESCEAGDSVNVIITKATADAGDDVEICKGDDVTLTVEGDGTYLWSNGETTQSIEVSPEVTTEYSVTVTNGDCEATDTVMVTVGKATADAGADQTICDGEEVMLSVDGEGDYLWSTGEITQSIIVSPSTTTEYSVIVTNGNCEAMDEVMVNVDDKVVIGDYVWLDENRNGMQDDGATGIKGMNVKLYQCNGDLVNSTETNKDGYYQFEVCPGTADYYVVFGEVPEGLKFTTSNEGNDSTDSDANLSGVTACFTITDQDDLTIDAGLVEICDINLEVIDEVKICANELLELTATLTDNTNECEGGCVYPVIEKGRCADPTPDNEVLLTSFVNGKKVWHRFKASEQRFEIFEDGSARYTATATDGVDNIEVDVTFTGHSTVPGPMGPKANECQEYDMSDWEYWSTWYGTITSQNHGVFTLSMKGAYFQMGTGADVTKSGFGASGWFYAAGGDGFYVDGDINIALDECIEKSATFQWTTADGNIISDANQKTITIDRPGTYVIEAVNCIDCVAVKTIVVTEDILCSSFAKSTNTPKMMKVYPVPVKSGGTLTIEFDREDSKNIGGIKATSLKASIGGNSNKENVAVIVYDMTGRVISTPRRYDLVGGKAVIYLDLDYIPTGKYILKAMGGTWSDSKNIIVR